MPKRSVATSLLAAREVRVVAQDAAEVGLREHVKCPSGSSRGPGVARLRHQHAELAETARRWSTTTPPRLVEDSTLRLARSGRARARCFAVMDSRCRRRETPARRERHEDLPPPGTQRTSHTPGTDGTEWLKHRPRSRPRASAAVLAIRSAGRLGPPVLRMSSGTTAWPPPSDPFTAGRVLCQAASTR